MTQKYIEDDLVMTRTEPNNFTPNGVVCKFVDYETIDKVLLRTINGIDGFIVEKGQFVPVPLTPSIQGRRRMLVRNAQTSAVGVDKGEDRWTSFINYCYCKQK